MGRIIIAVVVGFAVEIGGWDTTPAWYHIAFLILLIPSVGVGARLGAPKQD